MAIDLKKIRADFPILQSQVNGKPLVYLDNGATAQKPLAVIETIDRYYREYNSNVHRGVHHLSDKATRAYEESRKIAQKFVHAAKDHEIIFTKGTTDSINLVASSFGEKYIQAGDEILITHMEHHSNIVPWQLLCERKGAKLQVVPINERGELNMEAFANLLNDRTRLVSMVYVSNTLGTVNPVEEVIRQAHERDIPVMLDAAQAAPHMQIDVQALDVDFLALSAHKVFGPTGTGLLYGKERWLEEMPPYQGGGDMIRSVSFEKTIFNELPFKFEAGTPNIAGVIGMGAAFEYVQSIGYDFIAKHEADLLEHATRELKSIPGFRIVGEAEHKASVISFLVEGSHPSDIGTLLDMQGIAVRTGHHCTQPIMDLFKIPATARASFAFYNTREEIDMLKEGIEKVIKML